MEKEESTSYSILSISTSIMLESVNSPVKCLDFIEEPWVDETRCGDMTMKTMIKYEENEEMSACGCDVLDILAYNDDNAVEMTKSGAVDVIMKVMIKHEDSARVSGCGCGALCNLADHADN
jgi:hypothetical protein